MPTIDAIIKYGYISDLGLIDEPDLLVQSLTITPTREKQNWKGANLATRALRYTDPILTFAFTAIISAVTGFANQHPGTSVADLLNFSGNVYQFDPERGIMVFEDPSRSLTLENEPETSFNVVHYPFIGENDDSWEAPPEDSDSV
jgi:hypothetical protein